MKYFSSGKRGKIYLNKNIAIKKAPRNRIQNEVYWLKLLNRYSIGPKLISYGNNYFKYRFIKGDFILDFIEKSNKNKIKNVLINILKQCRILDKLKVNKKELHNPVRHIIINKKVNMIDFERCYLTNRPKNVTQFCQFILQQIKILKNKGFKLNKNKLINLLKKYKNNQNESNFKEILRYIREI